MEIGKQLFKDYSEKIKTFALLHLYEEVFKNYLKQLNIYFTEIGNVSLLYNVALDDVKRISEIFDTQPFVFCEFMTDKSLSLYYCDWDGKSYRLLDSSNISDIEDLKYFYLKHKDFNYKFSTNFSKLDNIDISYLDGCIDESLTMKERANNRAKFYKEGNIY